LAQLKDRYIIDEVMLTEFEDPKIAEHVAMVTIGNVEYNKAKDHVRNYSHVHLECYFILAIEIF